MPQVAAMSCGMGAVVCGARIQCTMIVVAEQDLQMLEVVNTEARY